MPHMADKARARARAKASEDENRDFSSEMNRPHRPDRAEGMRA